MKTIAFFIFVLMGFSCGDSSTSNNAQNNTQGNTSSLSNNSNNATNNGTGKTTPRNSNNTNSGKPDSIAGLKFEVVAVKQFRFGWADTPNTTHYKLLEKKNSRAMFEQIGEDIEPGIRTMDTIVPLYNRLEASYILQSCNEKGCTDSDPLSVSGDLHEAIGYFKSENSDSRDAFGTAIALSQDGQTLFVGAPEEDSNIDEDENNFKNSGAVYIFTNSNGKWVQQTMLKAVKPDFSGFFGKSLSISSDAKTLAVGARSVPTGKTKEGVIYVFEKQGTSWKQIDELSSDIVGRGFGTGPFHLSGDAKTLVAAEFSSKDYVHIFSKKNASFVLEQTVEGSRRDVFASSLAFSRDGTTFAVGAREEDGSSSGVDGDESVKGTHNSGAVYVYGRKNGTWEKQAYIKSDIPSERGEFGIAIALNVEGTLLAVGSRENRDGTWDNNGGEGVVHLYEKKNEKWSHQTKLFSKTKERKDFGASSISFRDDSSQIAIGEPSNDAESIGLNGEEDSDKHHASGAVYVFTNIAGDWTQSAFMKSTNPDDVDNFGSQVYFSGDGQSLAVGCPLEDSSARGVGRDPDNNDAEFSGAVYLF